MYSSRQFMLFNIIFSAIILLLLLVENPVVLGAPKGEISELEKEKQQKMGERGIDDSEGNEIEGNGIYVDREVRKPKDHHKSTTSAPTTATCCQQSSDKDLFELVKDMPSILFEGFGKAFALIVHAFENLSVSLVHTFQCPDCMYE
jgi:hypothetical protein